MSLATRCTACNTTFRVVQDQLKVSEGWVRCGRCNAVFNALESLFDLEPALAPAQAELAAPAPSEPAAVLAHEATPPPEDATPGAAREPVFVEQPPEHPPAALHPALTEATPASRVDELDRIDFADARFNVELLAQEGIPTGESRLDAEPSFDLPEGAAPAAAASTATADAEPAADTPAPEFLRRAERQARWSGPRARLALGLASVLLLSALGAQAALHWRDLLVTLFPESRPALQALCELAGCRIEPLRRIDDIVIESSALNALPGGEAVRLSVVLRNRGVFPLALPAIELTLTDGGGQMIARRILTPAEFGAGADAILPASGEAPLQLVLNTSGRRAAGYTVEPFYP